MVPILFLITGLNTGGAEMQVYQVIKTLRAQKPIYRPIVVSLLPPGQVGQKLEQENIPVYSLEMERGRPSMMAIVRLNQIIKKENIQLIHSHMYHANLLGRLIKFLHPDIKLVNTIHNIHIGGRNRERMLRLTNRLADSVTIISETARTYFVESGTVRPEKLLFLPNGVNTKLYQEKPGAGEAIKRELQLPDTAFTWLAVGRFDEQKNYPNLLQAFQRVVQKEPDTVLLIAGVGPLLDQTKKLAADLGLSSRVRFLGYRTDIPDMMSAADAYVMSSDWEGMPLVLQEASSVGLPIVCTDVGGNKEVVIEGETGFIVQPKSSFALAEGMLRLLRMDPESRTQMGEAGKDYMQSTFEMDRVAEKWHALYKQVLEPQIQIV
ncbi:glycosyltransferase [Domibacillus sp. DTU_2020_1001157_1_SI_ALB_TIR_016]|uniref:glycosyltransferase n=1 Tax=Domibacillus sp. DTU_2020_1001157_1_SI_ALB_TIR_016 TaxID=3077789 RepID=UPI0028E708A0|nr:glycosyltransferase [Domibacillus sp. DTU_2020_1001157_1_SI_ALB_TIR_016]WNS81210.1 glycosyltransferase [Domibacillus sp. DTU_2020_1001157_1_SI_ALB_TIR_016]